MKAENVECVACTGTGMRGLQMCEPCEGVGIVQVLSPPIACPRCNGSGHSKDEAFYGIHGCVVCRGTGWARML